MKVVKAETILVSIPFESGGLPPWGWGGAPANTFDILLVRLETEDGLVGWGEAFSRMADVALKQLIDTRVLPLVLGRDSRQIARIKHDIEFNLHNFGRSGSIMYGISAVDIALWDIAGKRAGQPLCNLIGGPSAPHVEVYASFVRYGTAEKVRAAVQRAIGQGYRWIKLHDIAVPVIRAACEAAAGRATVMLDVNCPWSVEQALAIDAEIADLGLHWFEEPVWPPENYRGLAAVRATGRHRIAAGEMDQQILAAAVEPDDALADGAFRQVGGDTPSQASLAHVERFDGLPDDRRERAANGFNFRQFGHRRLLSLERVAELGELVERQSFGAPHRVDVERTQQIGRMLRQLL